MKQRRPNKPYWDMTTKELAQSTKEFEEEFVAEKAKPLSDALKVRWARAKAKKSNGKKVADKETISVCLDAVLLNRCAALAKKKGLSRDALIAVGLRAFLAAEGERVPSTAGKRT